MFALCVGLVLAKCPLDTSHEKEGGAIQEWTAKATFSALSYWKHETTPSSADGVRRCFGWLQLADSVSLIARYRVACCSLFGRFRPFLAYQKVYWTPTKSIHVMLEGPSSKLRRVVRGFQLVQVIHFTLIERLRTFFICRVIWSLSLGFVQAIRLIIVVEVYLGQLQLGDFIGYCLLRFIQIHSPVDAATHTQMLQKITASEFWIEDLSSAARSARSGQIVLAVNFSTILSSVTHQRCNWSQNQISSLDDMKSRSDCSKV